MSDSVQFFIERVTPSNNVLLRTHWRQKGRDQKIWDQLVRAACGRRPDATTKQHVTITRYSPPSATGWIPLDYDNLVGGAKPLVDALTHAGVIVGDKPEWVKVEYGQAKHYYSGGRGAGMLVEIWEAE